MITAAESMPETALFAHLTADRAVFFCFFTKSHFVSLFIMKIMYTMILGKL